MTVTPLVHVEDLSVTFGDLTAVRGLSFQLTPGQCVALVGESGSGKSVTARSLLGLVGRGSTVSATTLRLGDHDLLNLTEREWRELRGSEVGLVLQDALVSLDPLARVGAQVAEPLRAHRRLGRAGRAERAIELLESAGVPDASVRARQYPHELSGGLRQRALIASAVAASPGVLIADEPTTALDVTVQAQVLALLDRLRQQGTGLILVSHDLAVVSQLADEILVLHRGEVVEQGAPDRVLGAPTSEYTKQLLAAIPSQRSRGQRLSATPASAAPASTAPASTAPRLTEAAAPAAASEVDRDTPVLQALDLVKHYPRPGGGETTALDRVSFALQRGRTLGIVGESGSGKSTAAHVVLGFTTPESGEVLLDGQPWSSARERDRRARRRRIQSISQDPLGSFDPRASVQAILSEALDAIGVPRSEQRDRSVALLEQVELGSAHLGRNPLELSGGQRQRVAISRALATDPEVIVCDEAVSALDVSIQAQVLDLLADLQERLGVSLLFISHDLGVIRHIAHEVLVMRSGRVVEAGHTEAVFTDPRHQYTRELIDAIPTLHVPTGPQHPGLPRAARDAAPGPADAPPVVSTSTESISRS
ncbi:ABC transporter ATP-binding protein [Leucobacter rhizosphaerae]|uniref:ABC transporter ATP-binding protein n=1 Tax=Leucobacter rhizosphaerae TaxID=2932245 RepID=A0ABY4FVI6_9MICO|nr:ABC transporter ATP-binding protein [Leucobacter rhizosphaerae]UOQ60321.1 ABC transporter ATP-binding protein [Leucobacter rhizosphaerae]